VYGPLGPGQTAFTIAANTLPPQGLQRTGTNLTDFTNALTLAGLAGLQQAETGNLYSRYAVSSYYQSAAGFLAQAYSAQAAAMVPILQSLCRLQQAQPSAPGN
jgi:hypothetical protein